MLYTIAILIVVAICCAAAIIAIRIADRKKLPTLTAPLPPVTGTALRQDGPEVKFQEPPKPPPAGT